MADELNSIADKICKNCEGYEPSTAKLGICHTLTDFNRRDYFGCIPYVVVFANELGRPDEKCTKFVRGEYKPKVGVA